MFLENSCTFYDRQIILLNIVILRSSLAQNAVHQRDFGKVTQAKQINPLRYTKNGSENKKTKFCRILIPCSEKIELTGLV